MNRTDRIDFAELTPIRFEELAVSYMNILFQEEGTKIELTPPKKDGGKDIIITHISKISNYKTWVECKNHKRNLGLSEIGKNVVLVIAQRINKLIFISATAITPSAKSDILNVSNRNNFDVLFLDGTNYKNELYKYPELLNSFFQIENAFNVVNNVLSIEAFFSEFSCEIDSQMSFNHVFSLERDNFFYVNYLIKNHTHNYLEDIHFEMSNQDTCINIISNTIQARTINPMSDMLIQIYCSCNALGKIVTFPEVVFSYKINQEAYTYIVEKKEISTQHIIKIPFVGEKATEFLYNKWGNSISLIQNNYAQVVMIYGPSGTGKTRLIEEMDTLCKQNSNFTKYIDCKNKSGHTILKKILAFILELPFDNNSLKFTKENIKDIILHEGGKEDYAECLYELFIHEKLDNNSLFYIKRALFYFLQNPRFKKPHVIFVDNIQECEEFIVELFIELVNDLHLFKTPVSIILSANIEVQSNVSEKLDELITCTKIAEKEKRNYCNVINVEPLNESDAKVFLINLFGGINSNDPLINQFMEKSGTRPFEMIMLYQYLCEKDILIVKNVHGIPYLNNYKDFEECTPPSIDYLIESRINNLKNTISDSDWGQCEKIIKCIVAFYDKLPSIFVDEVLKYQKGKAILLEKLFIRYEKYISNLEFYHDDIYRYFMKQPIYKIDPGICSTILQWIESNTTYEIENEEKIVFYCYYNMGMYKKTLQYGQKYIEKCFASFDFRNAYEICEILHELAVKELNASDYFRFCYIYAMSSWETVDIYKTLEIYCEMHSLLDVIEDVPIEDICKYYREYINANSHAGLYAKIEPLLDEFEALPNKSQEYCFVVKNRATVFHMRMNNFILADQLGNEALNIANEMRSNFHISTAYSDIAFNYLYNKKDYKNAIEYFNKAIEYYDPAEDDTYFRILEIHNQNALVNFMENDYKRAMQNIKKSIVKSHKLHNKYMEAKALNYQGIFQVHMEDYDSAYQSWINAIRINEKLGNTSSLICLYFNLSSLFLLQEKYQETLAMLHTAWELVQNKKIYLAENKNYNYLFYNYIICCYKLQKEDVINDILQEYPEFKDFYKNIVLVHDLKKYLESEYMNCYGIHGYSFL